MAKVKRPTIVDVARHAGVSKSTVSLVLQNSPLVRAETRAAVDRAMVALNYVYNRAAAKLRGAGVGLIGLVINDLRNPFFTEFASTAQRVFAEAGYATVIANTDENPAMQAQVIESMIEHDISGLLVSPAYGDENRAFDRLQRAGIPTMQVLRKVDARSDLFPFWTLDYATGGALATRHLIETGARHIAFVGGLEARSVTLERLSGYLSTMTAAGLTPCTLFGRPSRGFGRDMARRLHRERPEIEAALCFNDLVALGMISGFAELGVEVGPAFRVAGFDDIEECALTYPQLTSVRCDISEFGRRSAEALLIWIEGGERPTSNRRMAVELIVRQSSTGKRS